MIIFKDFCIGKQNTTCNQIKSAHSFHDKQSYDVVVIGGGHAGCEAAAASMGVNTASLIK